MFNSSQKQLTLPELANLWTQYLNDTMSVRVLHYLLKNCKDRKIRNILKTSIKLSDSHIEKIKTFFQEESYPIPRGFTDKDVTYNAPRLFSDNLILVYMQVMTLHGMSSYSLCVGTSIRRDQRKYFQQCMEETSELYDSIVGLMLEKGIYSVPPKSNSPNQIDFIKDQNYLSGWFGKKRSLNAMEVSGLHYNIIKTMVKVVLEVAFSQVAHSKEVRDYLQRGISICEKQMEDMESLLTEDHLPSPKAWQSEVTNSTVAPFSDKLMLFHVVTLISAAVGYYGAALASAQRRDLAFKYTKLIGEVGLYAEDGANLLIKNGWLEQPPMVDNREELARKKK